MIKSKVTGKVKIQDRTYPYIGEDTRDGMIILFTSRNKGVILNVGLFGSFSKVGDIVTSLPEGYYFVTTKEVCLSNTL